MWNLCGKEYVSRCRFAHPGESRPVNGAKGEIPMNAIFRKSMTRAAILALCTAALSAAPMMAQDNAAPQSGAPMGAMTGMRGGGQNQVEMLTKQLDLTPDQVTKVKAIDDDSMKQSMAVRSDDSVAAPDKRAKMMDIRKASQDKIRAVLTDEQKTKYDAMLEQMKARRGGGGQGAAPAAPPQQ